MLGPWDEALFRWVNEGWGSPALDPVFAFITQAAKLWPVRIGLASLLAFLLLYRPLTRASALQSLVAWPFAEMLSSIFKHTVPQARPCVELSGWRPVLDEVLTGKVIFLDSMGTMSAHAANMAAVATVMTLRMKWWGLPWIVAALLAGISRIYVGVHYPSQVVLGWLGGVLCAWVVVQTWDAFVALRTPRAVSETDTAGPQAS